MALHALAQEAPTGLLTPEGLGRLAAALILAEQDELVRRGHLPRDRSLVLRNPGLTAADRDGLTIDEEGLGFDSLSRLGLVMRLNRFFGLSTTGVEDYLLVRRRFGDWVDLIGEHVRLMGTRLELTFATSGSSGPVKEVSHGIQTLQDELAAHLAGPLARLPPGRIVAMVPPHHIYGCLFTILLPALSGRALVDLHQLPPTALARQGRPGDLVIGTPYTWDLVSRAGLALPAGLWGLTSAAPATALTFAAGVSPMIEVYGATETAGIATRDGPSAPFALLPHLQREGDAVGGRDLQDRLDWLDERRFHILGRKDDVIQVAGVNVSPSHVAGVIATDPGVAEVAVRPGSARLKAFVVAAPGHATTDLALRIEALMTTLPAAARPAPLTFGTALPRNAMGKLCDWDLEAGAN